MTAMMKGMRQQIVQEAQAAAQVQMQALQNEIVSQQNEIFRLNAEGCHDCSGHDRQDDTHR